MKKEGEIMARVLNRVNATKIPSHIKREIGIDDNWLNKVSPKQQKIVLQLSIRFKETLKKLSKN